MMKKLHLFGGHKSLWTVLVILIVTGCHLIDPILGQTKTDDGIEEFPHYGMITKIEDYSALKWQEIWKMTDQMTPEQRLNRTYIDDIYWPKLLSKLHDVHWNMKDMDQKILFQRKPSALMDAIMKVTSFKELLALTTYKKKIQRDELSIRFMEMSSAASKMHRFYSRRMRDILRDEGRIGMVALSILNYKAHVWGRNDTEGGFEIKSYGVTAKQTNERQLYLDGVKSVFRGIREILQSNADIVMTAQFDGKICEDNETIFNIEPAGLEGPYYVLFHLCLVDIKYFNLINFAHLYNQIYQGNDFTRQEDLRVKMREAVQYKIDLFDTAFRGFINDTSPTYKTYPGFANCDPKKWEIGKNYFKLTNFVKVFVAPEQELHKSGNCKQSCDMLDPTYRVCASNDTDCIMDEEVECLTKKDKCENFKPLCPPGKFSCQDATSSMTTCPSSRPDRLLEYIKAKEYHYGPKDVDCNMSTKSYVGGWQMEPDTLVDTPHFCEICTCYCFEPMEQAFGNFSVRYINTQYQRSMTGKNYIVVGVKFEKILDQVHIRIAEAQALPNRKVNESTIRWSDIKYQTNPTYIQRLDRDLRSINLDDIVVDDPERVVTGVRFYRAKYHGYLTYHYIGLEIRTSQITEDGKIVKDTDRFRRNANSTAHRQLHDYAPEPDGPNDPILTMGATLPDTAHNQYKVFVATSLDKDAGQSTIPYFNAQRLIRPKNPTWLKGIGIFHKSRVGYGGFLSLKLIEHHKG